MAKGIDELKKLREQIQQILQQSKKYTEEIHTLRTKQHQLENHLTNNNKGDFTKRWYYVFPMLLATLFGALGGYPGCQQFVEKTFYPKTIIFQSIFQTTGQPENGSIPIFPSGHFNNEGTSIFLSGIVSNSGKEPIQVYGFVLTIYVNDVKYLGYNGFIEDTMVLKGHRNKVLSTNGKQTGINRLHVLLSDKPENVEMLSFVDLKQEKILDQNNKVELVLECHHINNKVYSCKIPFDPRNIDNLTPGVIYTGSDIEILPLDSAK